MTSNRNVGKGDKPRPTDKKQYDSKFDNIKWTLKMENEFKQYRRTQIAEMRPVTQTDVELGRLIVTKTHDRTSISVSDVDLQNGSPKLGDMIARNPNNHIDQWLVAEQYFLDNFEVIK